MNGAQASLDWLYNTLAAVPELVTLLTDGSGRVKAFEAGKVPPLTDYPFLTAQVIGSPKPATPIGSGLRPVAYTTYVDVALWGLGNDDTPLQGAFDAMDTALNSGHGVLNHGWQVSCGQEALLPPAPPPAQPGDPETVRVGATYEIFAGAA